MTGRRSVRGRHRVGHGTDIRLRRHHLDATEHGPDAGQKLTHGKRFREIIVGPDFEADDAVDLLTFGGEQENRHGRLRSQRAADLETVDAWQHDVEYHGLRPLPARGLDRLHSIRRSYDSVAFVAKCVGECVPQRRLVIDDENCRRSRFG